MRFEGDFSLGDTPRIKAKLGSLQLRVLKEISFVVDTGSAMTIVGEDDLKLTNEILSRLTPTGSSQGVGGTRTAYVGGPCQIQLIDTKNTLKAINLQSVKFHTHASGAFNGSVLGMDVLKDFKISFAEPRVFLDL